MNGIGQPDPKLGARLLIVLALLSATGPIATDLYLPSLVEVKNSLHTDTASVQLTLTAFFLGLAGGHLLWGPVSDRYGRRVPLLIGSSIAVIAAAACCLAPSIDFLVGARLFQAFGAAAGMVIARAVISDELRGFAGARSLTLMMTIQGLAPIVAPLIGGGLAGHVSWRWILGVIVLAALAQLAGAITSVPETLPPERRTTRIGLGGIASRLRRPRFVAYALTQACTMAALMAFVSNSSFVYQEVIGTSSEVFAIGFAINALGMTVAGIAAARLTRRHIHPARVFSVALYVLVVATAGVVATGLSQTPWLIVLPLFVAVTAIGFLFGNGAALAMEQTRDAAGSGSAVLGASTFLAGALVSPLGGVLGNDSALPMGFIMLAAAILALACFTVARHFVALAPGSESGFGAPDPAAT